VLRSSLVSSSRRIAASTPAVATIGACEPPNRLDDAAVVIRGRVCQQQRRERLFDRSIRFRPD
jgi:hypothetical protein